MKERTKGRRKRKRKKEHVEKRNAKNSEKQKGEENLLIAPQSSTIDHHLGVDCCGIGHNIPSAVWVFYERKHFNGFVNRGSLRFGPESKGVCDAAWVDVAIVEGHDSAMKSLKERRRKRKSRERNEKKNEKNNKELNQCIKIVKLDYLLR